MEKKGTKAKDRTILQVKGREVLKALIKNRDSNTSLKTAITKLNKMFKDVGKDKPENTVAEMLEFVKNKCGATNLPLGYYGLVDELWRETPMSAIVVLQ